MQNLYQREASKQIMERWWRCSPERKGKQEDGFLTISQKTPSTITVSPGRIACFNAQSRATTWILVLLASITTKTVSPLGPEHTVDEEEDDFRHISGGYSWMCALSRFLLGKRFIRGAWIDILSLNLWQLANEQGQGKQVYSSLFSRLSRYWSCFVSLYYDKKLVGEIVF